MFFFYPFHNKNHAKPPAVDAQSHLLVTNQPLPVSLILLAAMNVLNNHHDIIFIENQWIIVYKGLQILIQHFIKQIVILTEAKRNGDPSEARAFAFGE